jgi:sugar phosphate isomerase/epimerase
MKLGAAAAIWWDHDERPLDLEAALGEIRDLGFHSAELLCDCGFFPGWGTGELASEAQRVRSLVGSLGLKVTLHSPFYNLNISTWNEGLRRETMSQLRDSMELAHILGADIVVVHPGHLPSRKFTREGSYNNMVTNLRGLAKSSADYGVTLCLENMASSDKSLCIGSQEVRRVVEEIGSDALKICLDLAHVHSSGERQEEYLRMVGDFVHHVHISDNRGGQEHLPIGEGTVDFKNALKALGRYDRILNLEGWVTQNRRETVKESRRRILDILKGL